MNAFRGGILRPAVNDPEQLEFISDGIIIVDQESGEVLVADNVDNIRDQIREGALGVVDLKAAENNIFYFKGERLFHSDEIAHSPYSNCHCHMCQPPGVDGVLIEEKKIEDGGTTFQGWLPTTLETENNVKKNPELVRKMARGKFLSYLENGITSSIEYTTSSEEVARIVLEEADKLGLADRVLVGYVAMDQEINFIDEDFELEDSVEEALAATESLLKDFGKRVVVIDRFPIACSSDLRRGLAKLAKEYGVLYETHVDESVDEQKIHKMLYQGRSIIQVLIDDGVLAPGMKVGLAHAIHTSVVDMEQVKNLIEQGCEVFIRMCPNSNNQLRSHWSYDEDGGEHYVQMPLAAWIGAGAKITMGLDKGAGRGVNMAAEGLWERGRRHANWFVDGGIKSSLTEGMMREPSYVDLWRYASLNGMESIGCDGGLRKGEKANFVTTRSRSKKFGFRQSFDDLEMIQVCGEVLESGQDSANIRQVYVEGRPVKVDGQMKM